MNMEMPPKKTMWERVKTAAKTFVSSAVGYIPRGIVIGGAIMGGSALLESMTGAQMLGITKLAAPDLIGHGLTYLAVGSVISGTIGAGVQTYRDYKDEAATAAAMAQMTQSKAGHGKGLLRDMAHHEMAHAAAEHVFTGPGNIPMEAGKHLGIG